MLVKFEVLCTFCSKTILLAVINSANGCFHLCNRPINWLYSVCIYVMIRFVIDWLIIDYLHSAAFSYLPHFATIETHSSSWNLGANESNLSYGITQHHLPSNTGKPRTHLACLQWGIEGWVDLGGWLLTIMRWFTCPQTVTRPSDSEQPVEPTTSWSQVWRPTTYLSPPNTQSAVSDVFKISSRWAKVYPFGSTTVGRATLR